MVIDCLWFKEVPEPFVPRPGGYRGGPITHVLDGVVHKSQVVRECIWPAPFERKLTWVRQSTRQVAERHHDRTQLLQRRLVCVDGVQSLLRQLLLARLTRIRDHLCLFALLCPCEKLRLLILQRPNFVLQRLHLRCLNTHEVQQRRVALLVLERGGDDLHHGLWLLRRELDSHDTVQSLEVHLLPSDVVLQVAQFELALLLRVSLGLEGAEVALPLLLHQLLLGMVSVVDLLFKFMQLSLQVVEHRLEVVPLHFIVKLLPFQPCLGLLLLV
mmetsp:Transcript_29541/g.71821  ORF Transcript_29541/g.71821 Transcript_29541/m.71821 type:complete len:271 (+) Transcript_29541:517-1329(+)